MLILPRVKVLNTLKHQHHELLQGNSHVWMLILISNKSNNSVVKKFKLVS